MAIQWRDQMSVGVKVIDEDHRRLIGIINEFEEGMTDGSAPAKLQAVAKKLYAYTQTHFEREERLQMAAKYAFHEAHKREHQKLLADLEDFIRRYFITKQEAVTPKTMDEMKAFLKHWLVDHIITNDLRMRPTIEAFANWSDDGRKEG